MKMSNEMNNLLRVAHRSSANVLITGPTGSGKSRLARQIHDQSSRRGRPFVVVNLATLHEGTIESELFGHERGAFTGADTRRIGRLELAQGGTVFLDEIGELPPRLQARLLEFLQSRTVSPIGSNREVSLDVRVIAATHRNLIETVSRKEFREDLFHRLRVISIELRPLVDRWDEFDEILHSCLQEVCAAANRSVLKISEDFAAKLEAYHWPGNLRELRNLLEFAVISSDGPVLSQADLPSWFNAQAPADRPVGEDAQVLGVAEIPLSLDYQGVISQFEREYLERALKRFRGRINLTARQIGMNKTTLIRRLRAYGLSSGRAS